jgi:nucleoside-diphosphate-sugar epimerase
MSTLITGGAGFVGLNLVQALLARGEAVVLCDRIALPPAAERAFSAFGKALTIVRGDILDPQYQESVFAARRIDRVVHCAVITAGTQRETREPAAIVEVNLNGTVAVLEAARKHGVQRVVYVGSGAVYGESLFRLPRLYEESACGPQTLYAITKFAAERMCIRLRDLWQLDIRCVRLGTVIGPWERNTGARDNYGTHTQLAGLAVRDKHALLTPREVRRDWIYAKDVAAGVVALLEAAVPHHTVYNLSSGVEWETPIGCWCAALKRAFPSFDYRVATADETPNIWYTDKDRSIMDTGRITNDLGYRPQYVRDAAYADFIDWIARNKDFYPGSAEAANEATR